MCVPLRVIILTRLANLNRKVGGGEYKIRNGPSVHGSSWLDLVQGDRAGFRIRPLSNENENGVGKW
jgi:hypothetical protein